jgi:hypothetical protein
MGMDVYGRAPTGEVGEYFRRNVWGWHPLASLVETLCKEEAAPCADWHSNDGDGLGADETAALIKRLVARRDCGDIVTYCAERDAYLAAAPPTKCDWCGGTGNDGDHAPFEEAVTTADFDDIFGPPIQPRPGEPCRMCNGVGTVEHWAKHYELEPATVDDFITFLKASGGFSIW